MIDPEDFPPIKNTTMSGQAGEFLTAYVLVRAGLQAVPVDVYGPDLWCRFPDGSVKTIEVKTAQAPTYRTKARNTKPSYSFQVPNRTADLFAFVALDKERVLFKLPEELPSYKTVRLETREFSIQNVMNSLGLLQVEELRKAA